MFDIIASVLTGGATGILGSLVGTVGRFLEKKQKLKEMTLQFDQEFKLQELQITSRKEELESERAIAEMESLAEKSQHELVAQATHLKDQVPNCSAIKDSQSHLE